MAAAGILDRAPPFAPPGELMPDLTTNDPPPDHASFADASRLPGTIPGWKDQRRALGIVIALAGTGVISLAFVASNAPVIIPALLFLLPVALATVVGGRWAGFTGLV